MGNLVKIKKVHFLGIGGISMSALAKYSLLLGKTVSGSDRVQSFLTDEVKGLGAEVYIGNADLSIIMPDIVVYTSAIDNSNPEIITAKKLNIPLIKRTEYLANVMSEFENKICVCGCHGKTTVTAMISHIFMRNCDIPTCFIGGIDKCFNNFFFGEKKTVIAEACEYKKNFLYLNPDTVVCTNIDVDHPDSYSGEADTVETFKEFLKNKKTVINADDKLSQTFIKNASITFGIFNGILRAENIKESERGSEFNLSLNGKLLGKIQLKLIGEFNIYNSLSAIACAILYNIPFEIIKVALEEFCGVKRRMEYMGKLYNLSVYCDYAHHPKELKESINSFCTDKTLVVFQPHTYSRTKALMQDFTESLSVPKKVLLYKTYSAREDYCKEGDSKTLCRNLKKLKKDVKYVENEKKLLKEIKKLQNEFNSVIFFGAGDIYQIVQNLL